MPQTLSVRMTKIPDRIELAPGLEVSRVVTGLWQVADMERGGKALNLDAAAASLGEYAAAGFHTFDMVDNYGSAKEIAAEFSTALLRGLIRDEKIRVESPLGV